jgi:hypothetical protein
MSRASRSCSRKVEGSSRKAGTAGEAIVKRFGLLIGVLLLGSLAASKAEPQDSADVVYIDGLPCNRFCQFYMARSRGLLAQQSADDHAKGQKAKGQEALSASAVRDRLAKMAAARNEMPQTRTAALQPGSADAENSHEDALDVHPESRASSVRDHLVTAAAIAEHLTTSVDAASELKAMNGDRFDRLSVATADSGKRNAAAPSPADARVVLVISRPEMKSISYLTRADIAIDGERSAIASSIRTALMTAGAVDVRVEAGKANAIDRLMRGEVQAAVLTLVSAEAARAFPDIDGFRIFKVALPPRS